MIGEKLGAAIADLISGTKGLSDKIFGGAFPTSPEGLVIDLLDELSQVEIGGFSDIKIFVPYTEVDVTIYKVDVCFSTTYDPENRFRPVKGFKIDIDDNPGLVDLTEGSLPGGQGGQQQRAAKKKAAQIAGQIYRGYAEDLKKLEEFLKTARGIPNKCKVSLGDDDLDEAPVKPDYTTPEEKCYELLRKIAKKNLAIKIFQKKVNSINKKLGSDPTKWSDKELASYHQKTDLNEAIGKLKKEVKKLEEELKDCLRYS